MHFKINWTAQHIKQAWGTKTQEETLQKIKKLYLEGTSIEKLAQICYVSAYSIRRVLIGQGTALRGQGGANNIAKRTIPPQEFLTKSVMQLTREYGLTRAKVRRQKLNYKREGLL
jgi:hypothetical protein